LARKPPWLRRLALREIVRLFELAEKRALSGDMDLSNRYVQIARKMSMKYNVRIPKHLKRRFCKHCYSYLLPGRNCRVRVRSNPYPRVVVTCLSCGKITRYPYLEEKKNARRKKTSRKD